MQEDAVPVHQIRLPKEPYAVLVPWDAVGLAVEPRRKGDRLNLPTTTTRDMKETYVYLVTSTKPLPEEALRDVLIDELATGSITELVGVKEPTITNITVTQTP